MRTVYHLKNILKTAAIVLLVAVFFSPVTLLADISPDPIVYMSCKEDGLAPCRLVYRDIRFVENVVYDCGEEVNCSVSDYCVSSDAKNIYYKVNRFYRSDIYRFDVSRMKSFESSMKEVSEMDCWLL